MRKKIVLLSLLLYSCKSYNDHYKIVDLCNGRIDTLLVHKQWDSANKCYVEYSTYHGKIHGEKIVYSSVSPNVKRLSQYYLNGNIFGDNEVYFDNGQVYFYKFKCDSLNYNFWRAYDEQGHFIDGGGSPKVFQLIGTNSKSDTLNIKYVFSDRMFSAFEVEVSLDGKIYYKKKLDNCDEEFPFNKVYHHIQAIDSTMKPIPIFFRISCIDKYTKKQVTYFDTAYYKRKK